MIGAEQLALLNDGAVVVNVARGHIIDEVALRNARRGKLRGAVLDVFDREPLDEASLAVVDAERRDSPAYVGFRASHWDDVTDLFTENLRRYQSGDTLVNPVDAAAGY